MRSYPRVLHDCIRSEVTFVGADAIGYSQISTFFLGFEWYTRTAMNVMHGVCLPSNPTSTVFGSAEAQYSSICDQVVTWFRNTYFRWGITKCWSLIVQVTFGWVMDYLQARICLGNVRRTQFSLFNPKHKSRKQPSVPQHSREGIQGTLSLQTRTALQTHPGRHSSMGRWRFAELSAYEMNTSGSDSSSNGSNGRRVRGVKGYHIPFKHLVGGTSYRDILYYVRMSKQPQTRISVFVPVL